jgi:ribosome-binding factor A
MHRRKVFRRAILSATGEIGPGDGQDPRYDSPANSAPVKNRKALQLGSQVAETLAFVLADSGDAVLQNLIVVAVVPFPTSVRLLVTLSPAVWDEFDEQTALFHLEHARSRLRSELAASIQRRKVPELLFRIALRS